MQHAFLCRRRSTVKLLNPLFPRRFSYLLAVRFDSLLFKGKPSNSSAWSTRTVRKSQDCHGKTFGEGVGPNDVSENASSNFLTPGGREDIKHDVAHIARKSGKKGLRGRRDPEGVLAYPFPTDIGVLLNELPSSGHLSSVSSSTFHLEEYVGVSDALKWALPSAVKSTDEPRVFHPSTPHGLLRKMIQITTFKPLPSFSKLLKFHEAYPHLQSTKSFNYLIQHAIRHTDYTTAHKLLQRMSQMGVPFDTETRILRVRLLVRMGKGIFALKEIKKDILNGLEESPETWIELLGYAWPRRRRNGVLDENTPKSDGKQTEVHLPEDESMEWKEGLLNSLSKTCLLIQNERVLDRFAFLSVQLLLRDAERDAAQELTNQWLARLPSRLSKTRAQRCLDVLHLHLAHSEMGVKSHIATRGLIKEFLRLCPCIKPNSSTLYLLLRSLKRSCVNGTAVALSSVHAFQGEWGSAMVDRRVRRRVVAIALKEGKLSVVRHWLAVEERLAGAHDSEALVRQVAGVQQPKVPTTSRKLPMRRYMVGQEAENRKWTWLRRRYARTQTRQRGTDEVKVDFQGR